MSLDNTMDSLVAGTVKSVASVIGVIGLVFLVMILAPFIGGVVGWLFAWVFPKSFDTALALLRVDATGFQLGAALGFIGALLRLGSRSSSKES